MIINSNKKTVFLGFAVIFLLNLISSVFYSRLDFTEDRRYSLSDPTKELLRGLKDPVTLTLYFSKDLPPELSKIREDLHDMLREYSSISGGKILFKFVDPSKDPSTESLVQSEGIAPISVPERSGNEIQSRKIYMGALMEYGARRQSLPSLNQGSLEYSLSTAIQRLSIMNKPEIGFVTGQAEAPLSSMQEISEMLSSGYSLKEFLLSKDSKIPLSFRALVIVAPKDSFSLDELSLLDGYLSKGGRLLLAFSRVGESSTGEYALSLNTGLPDWLLKKGVEVENNLLVDMNCASVSIQASPNSVAIPVKFPYFPVITKFGKHQITSGLRAVLFQFASSINLLESSKGLNPEVLASTSARSDALKPPVRFDFTKQWNQDDFLHSSFKVGLALEGKTGGDRTKMVVFSDGEFPVNGEGENARRIEPDNLSLFANSVDWLCDDRGLTDLRTKGIKSRPLTAMLSDDTKDVLSYLNFLFPICAVMLIGGIRYRGGIKKAKALKTDHWE